MVAASIGFTLASNPASNARTRWRPIWSGVLSLAASRSGVFSQHGIGFDPRRQRGAQRQVYIVALPIAQAAKLEHGRPVADFLHQ